jgi:hypothetical protein
MPDISGYHDTRLPYDARREVLWKALCEYYFQPLISPDACVLEMGAGYGHFINNIRCAKRIALDQWAGLGESVEQQLVRPVRLIAEIDFRPQQHHLAFADGRGSATAVPPSRYCWPHAQPLSSTCLPENHPTGACASAFRPSAPA